MSALALTQKPEILKVDFNNIPTSLKKMPHWLVWRLIPKPNNEWTKPPFQTNGQFAKTNDDSTHTTFEQACDAYKRGSFGGIGIVLRDGICGIDLDHVVSPDGSIEVWAQEIIDRFAGTYMEKSPSVNRGVKMYRIARQKCTS